MSDMGWSAYTAAQEAAATGACIEAAGRAGYTPEQADMCDDGHMRCATCPWRNEAGKYQERIFAIEPANKASAVE